MRKGVLPNLLPLALLVLLSSSCDAELLVGEQDCHGDGVDCDADVPTRYPFAPDGSVTHSNFDVVASRTVAPTWTYDLSKAAWTQLEPAPNGGVWALHAFTEAELLRLNAEGEPVESHALDAASTLAVDDELGAVVLGWRAGYPTRTTVGPLGELLERTVGPVAEHTHSILVDGPSGTLRVGAFAKRGSYVAEYDSRGELVWKQSDVRDAHGFPYANLGAGNAPVVSYRMAALSDGSIAVAVPKDGDLTIPGLVLPEQAQGLTLIEPDGNVRWELILGESTFTTFLAPGLDGSVVYASGVPEGSSRSTPGWLFVHVLDRDGELAASWIGRRKAYHDVLPRALCTDSAGMIYALVVSGERDAPVPTVCRLDPGAPKAATCLGVEDGPHGDGFSSTNRYAITAPEPGMVVFSAEHGELQDEQVITSTRLIRIDF